MFCRFSLKNIVISWKLIPLAALLVISMKPVPLHAGSHVEDALNLANLLRASRTVISANQALINDPDKSDKGLTGKLVSAKASDGFFERTGYRPDDPALSPRSRELLAALMSAIEEVVDEHQVTINKPGVGFKGFVPAVFGRLVNERFGKKAAGKAEMIVTAPMSLVRNRKARPDRFERKIINTRFMLPDWPRDKVYEARVDSDDGPMTRILVPEYYKPACMSCHGGPKGKLDVTGYPMEGAKPGDLGGVISIRLYDRKG